MSDFFTMEWITDKEDRCFWRSGEFECHFMPAKGEKTPYRFFWQKALYTAYFATLAEAKRHAEKILDKEIGYCICCEKWLNYTSAIAGISCANCWEVENRLDEYLKSWKGREFVYRKLAQL